MSAEYFETRFALDARRVKVWRKLTPFFQTFIPSDSSILEIGAGYCYFINEVKATRKIAVDLFENLSKYASKDVEAYVCSALHMNFIKSKSIDTVFASNFLEHLDHNELSELVVEVTRVLKTGGQMIIMQPNFRLSYRRYFDDYTHKTIFTDQSIVDWFESNGFETLLKYPRFMPFSVKKSSGNLSWLIPLYLRLPFKPFAGQMMFVFKLKIAK